MHTTSIEPDPESALQLMMEYLSESTDAQQKAAICERIGVLSELSGDLESAVRYYSLSYQYDVNRSTSLLETVRIYYETGQVSMASEYA